MVQPSDLALWLSVPYKNMLGPNGGVIWSILATCTPSPLSLTEMILHTNMERQRISCVSGGPLQMTLQGHAVQDVCSKSVRSSLQ